jgi:hypothetical protein
MHFGYGRHHAGSPAKDLETSRIVPVRGQLPNLDDPRRDHDPLQFRRKENSLPLVYDPFDFAELASPSESPLQACVRAERTERLKATTPAVKTQLFRARAALSRTLLRESGRLPGQRTSKPKRRARSAELAA